MSAVRYEAVEKRFGAFAALRSLNLDVPDHAFLALLGPSGCGKTTALRILAGLELPTDGRVFIGERNVTRLQPRDRDVAMVFQSYALYPHMTVAENIAYPLRIRKIDPTERERRVSEVAAALEVGHLLDRRPAQLSGGQRQRIALARAIVREPAAFLMDEPLSNLDARLRVTMRGEIKRLCQRLGTTTLYVTHDQAEALSLSTRVDVLSNGVLVQEGRPEEIYWKPRNAFVAEFVGAANLVPARVVELREMGVVVETEGGARLPVGSGTHTWSMGDAALLCLRPEALRVEEAALAPGGIPGTVTAHVFEGSRQLYDVSIPGGIIKIEMITSALVGRSFKLGDHVKVEVSPETSILLPDDRGAA